ncbi:hypothetical protein KAU34_07220 [candidate division WOR-3 bacterium]|nr:hypothetical protein [candidate division WOR-3 bacterium]MCK4576181.1 hypothetical protein [candidate division WOR-3 bacterium]
MKESCERFLRSIEDTKWVVQNLDKIKEKYKSEFIAVLNCKIIAHHKKIEELMRIIESEFPDDVEFITTEFIGSKEIKVIL